ncbi:MAG: hypothetical protein IT383_01195 [Deltaproteobacteria bacterium]|nr:hypothetical protein [Deltaproteobacteria bacterium]
MNTHKRFVFVKLAFVVAFVVAFAERALAAEPRAIERSAFKLATVAYNKSLATHSKREDELRGAVTTANTLVGEQLGLWQTSGCTARTDSETCAAIANAWGDAAGQWALALADLLDESAKREADRANKALNVATAAGRLPPSTQSRGKTNQPPSPVEKQIKAGLGTAEAPSGKRRERRRAAINGSIATLLGSAEVEGGIDSVATTAAKRAVEHAKNAQDDAEDAHALRGAAELGTMTLDPVADLGAVDFDELQPLPGLGGSP